MEGKMLFETDVPELLASSQLTEGGLGKVSCLVWQFEELVVQDADVDETSVRRP